MKKSIFCLTLCIGFIFSISTSVFANSCKPTYLKPAKNITIKKGETKKIFGDHVATYHGFFGTGKMWQLKFGDSKTTLTTASTILEATIETIPPIFVGIEVVSVSDEKIEFKLKRFEKSRCYVYDETKNPMRR